MPPPLPARLDLLGEHDSSCRVESPFDLDRAMAVDEASALAEAGQAFQRQPRQGSTFHLGKQGADVPSPAAVDAGVGYRLLPVEPEALLLVETGEPSPLEGVLLDVVKAAFNLALMPWPGRLGGQPGDALVLAEGANLGVDLGIKPIGLGDGGTKVIQNPPL